jgi:hypothetical protein
MIAGMWAPTRDRTWLGMTLSGDSSWCAGRILVLCGSAFVMMVQATYFSNLNNVAFGAPPVFVVIVGIFAERQVRAPAVVIRRIRSEGTVQGAIAEHDHVVQTLTTNGTDEPFDVGPLPQRHRDRGGAERRKTVSCCRKAMFSSRSCAELLNIEASAPTAATKACVADQRNRRKSINFK